MAYWTTKEIEKLRTHWAGDARSGSIRTELPGRTPSSIYAKAKKLGIAHPRPSESARVRSLLGVAARKLSVWTEEEIETMRRLWPRGSRAAIKAAFPKRKSWRALSYGATLAGVVREAQFTEPMNREALPVVRQLVIARKVAGIMRKDLAHRLGVALGTLYNLEHGYADPPARRLAQWCKELGMELSAKPIMAVISLDDGAHAAPTKERMMAGR